MKTHRVLYQQLGENATTSRDPVAVVIAQDGNEVTARSGNREFTVDLTATCTVCVSYDNNMLVSKDKYSVGEVELPDWLSPDEWLRNTTRWKYTWGFGADRSWPESWQRFVAGCGEAQKYSVIKLLKTKKFRSKFRASLREQLERWLDTAPEDRQYDSPFSYRQWDCLISPYDKRNARGIASSLYHSR
jgi:hypothetical protein